MGESTVEVGKAGRRGTTHCKTWSNLASGSQHVLPVPQPDFLNLERQTSWPEKVYTRAQRNVSYVYLSLQAQHGTQTELCSLVSQLFAPQDKTGMVRIRLAWYSGSLR